MSRHLHPIHLQSILHWRQLPYILDHQVTSLQGLAVLGSIIFLAGSDRDFHEQKYIPKGIVKYLMCSQGQGQGQNNPQDK